MIDVLHRDNEKIVLLVSGHCAMGWRENMWLLASLALVMMGMAVPLAVIGFWMILPFAGAELLLLATGLYLTARRMHQRELISVDSEWVTVRTGYHRPESSIALQKARCRLQFQQDASLFDVGRLALRHHAKHIPIGGLLGRDEKQVLYRHLQGYLPVTVW